MGCVKSKDTTPASEEETLVSSHEYDLGFDRHSAQIIEAQIKREAANGEFTLPKLQRLMTSLRLCLPFDKPESACMKFIESLKHNTVISMNRLVITGLLLGCGSLQKRAQLLFEHADSDAKRSLERREVVALLEEISFIVVECLPILAYSDRTESMLRAYQGRLMNNINTQIQLAVTSLMQGGQSVSQRFFETRLSKPDLRVWLVPRELRRALMITRNDVRSSIKSCLHGDDSLFFKKVVSFGEGASLQKSQNQPSHQEGNSMSSCPVQTSKNFEEAKSVGDGNPQENKAEV
jgi:hypothetical protein